MKYLQILKNKSIIEKAIAFFDNQKLFHKPNVFLKSKKSFYDNDHDHVYVNDNVLSL